MESGFCLHFAILNEAKNPYERELNSDKRSTVTE